MSSGKDSSLEAASKAADVGTATTCPLKPSSTMLPIRTAKQSTKPVEPKRSAADSRQEPSNNLSTVKYMRIFDIYKKLGIGKYIDLPQLVLAGPKQCGKSSIIENITSYSVQHASELKTQFLIEFALIDDQKMAHVKATIILDPNCSSLSPEALEKVRSFNIDHARSPHMTKDEFKTLLNETSNILTMSPSDSDQNLGSIQSPAHKIWSHTLRLVMKGPPGINFSIIDTPGVLSDCPEDSSSDCNSANQLVLPLIKQSRTIIAASFEAKTTKHPDEMFSWMRNADHEGRRTIGIMTKCDLLSPRILGKTAKELFAPTQLESNSNNKFIPAYGFYGVRNRTIWDSMLYTSLEGVREHEAALFGTTDWRSRASERPMRLGIHELILGLNEIFASHVRTQYASVAAEIRVILAQRREQLNLLGPVTKPIVERREYLKSIVTNYDMAMLRCLQDDSSHVIPNGSDLPDILPGKRIALQKTVFENLLSAREGHLAFHSATGKSDSTSDHAASAATTPEDHTGDMYTWINQRYQSMKGSTLPGVVPYPLVDSLFQEQTVNWSTITNQFVDAIENILLETSQQCLRDTCRNQTVVARLTELALQRTKMKIDLWRKSCLSILDNERERPKLLSHEFQEVNAARTLSFLGALTSLEQKDEALDASGAPMFGPPLCTEKPADRRSKSESPSSSLSSSPSPRTPQSIRSHDAFGDDPFYNSDVKREADSEWKIFNLDDDTRNSDPAPFRRKLFNVDGDTRNWDSSPFRMRCVKVPRPRISSTSTAGTEYIRRAQEIITNDRQVIYQIHDTLNAYYNVSLRNYIASVFKTLQPTLKEVIGCFSVRVDWLPDEKISWLFEESDADAKARKCLEEDIQRLQLAVLEAEVIFSEPTSGSSSNQPCPREE
ncbi:hypothetical protein L207DRAFT_331461 [Hyaloscypha variabilis F]|uniref:Uncharacterized protein n=1 Tax=Hyaloscypha variabilis (strain UAMH 11265 / GT02V1 / F) TaxID=1149755 RepID=A0A2J6RTA8_HYAVF|nr:hypothetical protein L207DRAFT_331461 [Hyaloscypha variabilis F]